MKRNLWLSFLFIVLLLATWFSLIACDSIPSKIENPPAVATPSPDAVEVDVESLAWKQPAWDKHLRNELNASSLPDIMPADIDAWCPKYTKISRPERRDFWAHLAVAIVKRESGYNSNSAMKESDGTMSEGLFQMTYGNSGCPSSKTKGDLRNPLVNITCGVNNMEKNVAMDKVVATGGYTKYGAPSPKGLARYWSVVRVPDTHSSHYKKEFQAITNALTFCKG